MPAEKNAQYRQAFVTFMQGDARRFKLAIDCHPKDRIRFIYSVIFPGAEKLRFYGRFLIARVAHAIDYSPIKVFLYRLIGMKIGSGVFISPGVILDPHFPSLIEIGDHVIIGWGSHLFTHEFSGSSYSVGRICIGQGAVIGGFSIVRSGVTVGENAQVASTSIVYKDVPDNHCYDSDIRLNRVLLEINRRDDIG